MVNNVSSRYTGFLKKGVPLTTLDSIRTKGQCKLSEKELVSKIVDLAHRDTAVGKNSLHDDQFVGSEWNKLFQDFISLSSPDRAGIIQKKLSYLTGNTTSIRLKGFDLFYMLNRRKIRDPDVGPDYIDFKDENGREVATYSKSAGWVVYTTPGESARCHAFIELWNQALADAQEELKQEPSGDGDIIFEARA